MGLFGYREKCCNCQLLVPSPKEKKKSTVKTLSLTYLLTAESLIKNSPGGRKRVPRTRPSLTSIRLTPGARNVLCTSMTHMGFSDVMATVSSLGVMCPSKTAMLMTSGLVTSLMTRRTSCGWLGSGAMLQNRPIGSTPVLVQNR